MSFPGFLEEYNGNKATSSPVTSSGGSVGVGVKGSTAATGTLSRTVSGIPGIIATCVVSNPHKKIFFHTTQSNMHLQM